MSLARREHPVKDSAALTQYRGPSWIAANDLLETAPCPRSRTKGADRTGTRLLPTTSKSGPRIRSPDRLLAPTPPVRARPCGRSRRPPASRQRSRLRAGHSGCPFAQVTAGSAGSRIMRARRSAGHHSRDGPAARPPYWRYAWPASPTIDLRMTFCCNCNILVYGARALDLRSRTGFFFGNRTRFADVGPSRGGGRSGSGRGGEGTGTSTAVVAATAPPPRQLVRSEGLARSWSPGRLRQR